MKWSECIQFIALKWEFKHMESFEPQLPLCERKISKLVKVLRVYPTHQGMAHHSSLGLTWKLILVQFALLSANLIALVLDGKKHYLTSFFYLKIIVVVMHVIFCSATFFTFRRNISIFRNKIFKGITFNFWIVSSDIIWSTRGPRPVIFSTHIKGF